MFQNISGQDVQEEQYDETITKNEKRKLFIKNVASKQNIAIYILSFMLSTIECVNGIAPFAISIFAATLSNKIPAVIIYFITVIGTFIGLGSGQALNYILTSLVFIGMTLIFKPKEKPLNQRF